MFKYNKEIGFWLEVNIFPLKDILILKIAKQKISKVLDKHKFYRMGN